MMKKISSKKVSGFQWLLWSWLMTAILTLPALICLYQGGTAQEASHKILASFCQHFELLGFFSSLFGPLLLMPLFFTLLMIQRLARHFYPKDTILILASHTASVLTALLCVILFIVPVTTMNVPYSVINLVSHPIAKMAIETFLLSLWLAPAGMLYMLALFMIQFGLLPKTINQGYKPLLMYIVSGGVVAFTFGIFSTMLGTFFPSPTFIPKAFTHAIDNPHPILLGVLNPYTSLLLDAIAALPLFYIFKVAILKKIKL